MSNLLVVEDDEDLRELLVDILELRGHAVRVVPDGVQALKQLDIEFPQVVISDLEMPVLDGQALIYRMFVEDLGRENVPVILMSASTRLKQVAEAAGTPYVLAKPFSIEALVAIVDRALTEAIPPRPPGAAGATSGPGPSA